MTTPEQIDQL